MQVAKSKLALILALGVSSPAAPLLPLAQAQESIQPVQQGVVVGRVYEVDKEAYRKYIEELRKQDGDFEENLARLDAEEFLVRRADVTVVARQLSSNLRFSSEFSTEEGEYSIHEAPVGTFEFTLQYEGVDYPVEQRLDLNVQLNYVAELCFVLDREERVGWTAADGVRRSPEVPPWVPRECRSALTDCLAGITGDDEAFPDGLLLLTAGSGASALGTSSSDSTPPSANDRR